AGVTLVHDEDGLDAALAYLADARRALAADITGQGIADPSAPDSEGDVLIEEFQTGEEFSAEGVFVHGVPRLLAVTAKLTTGAPHFIELGQAMPAASVRPETVAATLERALPALGLGWGAFHVEFWAQDDGQLVLGEVHVRPGGDYIHVMAQHITDA